MRLSYRGVPHSFHIVSGVCDFSLVILSALSEVTLGHTPFFFIMMEVFDFWLLRVICWQSPDVTLGHTLFVIKVSISVAASRVSLFCSKFHFRASAFSLGVQSLSFWHPLSPFSFWHFYFSCTRPDSIFSVLAMISTFLVLAWILPFSVLARIQPSRYSPGPFSSALLDFYFSDTRPNSTISSNRPDFYFSSTRRDSTF